MEKKRQHVQGARWRRLDNTAKVFPGITNEELSNVFRVSMVLREPVDPALLETALGRVLPGMEGFRVKLRRGFFWYYFETNRKMARVEKEDTYPCRFIDPHSSQMFLFRVSYYDRKVNLEVFHALTDGLGGVNFLKALVCEYLRLKRGEKGPGEAAGNRTGGQAAVHDVEDSYRRNYKKMKQKRYATHEALPLTGEAMLLDTCSVIHGIMDVGQVKRAARARGVSITKYLTAALIWSIMLEYGDGRRPVGINLPVNLRNIFGSETEANFFAVTLITCLEQETGSFEAVLASVSCQMDENLKRDRLEETISYNVSNEENLLVRLVPLALKGVGVRAIFARSSRAYTATLSNLGAVEVEEEFRREIEGVHAIIGVSRQQPFKGVAVTWGDQLILTFSSVLKDIRLQKRFFQVLTEQGIPVRLESNGVPEEEREIPMGMYPRIPLDEKLIKKGLAIFYASMILIAGLLGVINMATYHMIHVRWSFLTAGCAAYAVMTVRYSIMRNSNLAFKLVIQSLGIQCLLVAADWVTGYRGWAVNYAIPGVILFDVAAVAGLMVFNRLNWQSYFMYQIAITVFSFIPLILCLTSLVNSPYVTGATAAISVLVLLCTIILGDRSVKNELIRRFHI